MKKQFLWIMTDTTRFDMLGCYGNAQMHTPCLDAMAQDGMRFERVYTTQPVCGPARSALFTGQYPHSNGSWGNCMPLGADVQTLGQRMQAEGIPCAYIGKWHLDAGDYFGNGVCPDGWDPAYWYDMRNYLDELTPEQRLISRQTEACQEAPGIAEEFTFGYRCTRRALDYLDKHREDDFFLVVSYDEPH
ncbi:MAG: sulfatase-like hydrolase/transferase, partial [Clostridia bacterium]